MRINPTVTTGVQGFRQAPDKRASNAPGFSDILQSVARPSASIEVNRPIDLGQIGGKPIVMTIRPDGIDWTGSPHIPGPTTPGSPVTAEQRAAVEMFEGYSRAEHAEVQKSLGIVRQLWLITRQGAPTSKFGEYVQQMSLTRVDVETALRRLNLDPDSLFSINGRTFALGPNGLEEQE